MTSCTTLFVWALLICNYICPYSKVTCSIWHFHDYPSLPTSFLSYKLGNILFIIMFKLHFTCVNVSANHDMNSKASYRKLSINNLSIKTLMMNCHFTYTLKTIAINTLSFYTNLSINNLPIKTQRHSSLDREKCNPQIHHIGLQRIVIWGEHIHFALSC